MSVVANVAINVDSRDAAAKLRQFQQQSTAAGRAAEQLQASTDRLQSAFTKQRGSTAELAKRLRELKTEYERLTASAKESARAGGEGFSAATVGKLRKLSSEINSTREAFLKSKAAAASYKAELDKVATASDGLNRTQRKASTEINSLAASLGRLAIAYFGVDAAARATTNAIQQGIAYESAAARLRNLSAAFGETEEATQLAERASTRFGQGITQSTEQVAQLYGRLRPLGLTLSEVEAIQNGFNTAARLSGATAAESAGALLQLSQALGAGALRGEEFNSVAEQAPLVLQALGKELNVPIGQLKGLAQEGKITSDVVIRALARISVEGADKLSGSLDTSAQRVKDLQNAFERLQIALSKLALPSLLRVLEGITVQLENGTRFVTNLGDAWDYVAGRLAPVVGLFQQLASNPLLRLGGQAAGKIFEQTGPGIALRGLDFLRNQVPAGIANLAQRGRQSRQQSFVGPATPQWFGPAPRMVPTQSLRERLGVTDRPDRAGGRKGGGKSEAEKAAEAAKRQAEELKRSYELGTQLGTQYQRQLLLLDASTEQERRRLQIQFDFQDREKQISELKSKTQQANLRDLSNEQKRLELRQLDLEYLREQLSIFERIAGLDFSKTADLGKRAFAGGAGTFDPSLPDLRVSPAEQQMAKYREELAALTNPINMAVAGADAIGSAFGQAFQDIATGAKSTQEALADAFKGIGEAFIQMAAQIIAKQLAMIAFQTILKALGGGGGGFGFSGAGPAALPSGDGFAAGFSMPALMADGGYVTGPTDAVIGEGGEPEYVIPASKMRSAMARYSSGARGDAVIPGSSAEPAGGGGGVAVAAPIDVRYTVERINSVDYVTADQFQRGMAQAAEQGARQGERRALYSLRQNTNVRKSIGV